MFFFRPRGINGMVALAFLASLSRTCPTLHTNPLETDQIAQRYHAGRTQPALTLSHANLELAHALPTSAFLEYNGNHVPPIDRELDTFTHGLRGLPPAGPTLVPMIVPSTASLADHFQVPSQASHFGGDSGSNYCLTLPAEICGQSNNARGVYEISESTGNLASPLSTEFDTHDHGLYEVILAAQSRSSPRVEWPSSKPPAASKEQRALHCEIPQQENLAAVVDNVPISDLLMTSAGIELPEELSILANAPLYSPPHNPYTGIQAFCETVVHELHAPMKRKEKLVIDAPYTGATPTSPEFPHKAHAKITDNDRNSPTKYRLTESPRNESNRDSVGISTKVFKKKRRDPYRQFTGTKINKKLRKGVESSGKMTRVKYSQISSHQVTDSGRFKYNSNIEKSIENSREVSHQDNLAHVVGHMAHHDKQQHSRKGGGGAITILPGFYVSTRKPKWSPSRFADGINKPDLNTKIWINDLQNDIFDNCYYIKFNENFMRQYDKIDQLCGIHQKILKKQKFNNIMACYISYSYSSGTKNIIQVLKTDGHYLPSESIKLKMVHLIEHLWYYHEAFLKAAEKKNIEFYQNKLYDWLWKELFNPAFGLPVIGEVKGDPIFWDDRDFGPTQLLLIQYLTEEHDDVKELSVSLVGIWHKNIHPNWWYGKIGPDDNKYWEYMIEAIKKFKSCTASSPTKE